jgi:hypothetical protein
MVKTKKTKNKVIRHSEKTLNELWEYRLSEEDTYDAIIERILKGLPGRIKKRCEYIRANVMDNLLAEIAFDVLIKEDGGSKKL